MDDFLSGIFWMAVLYARSAAFCFAASQLVEVGDLSRRQVKPDRAVADLFSHYRSR
jgi:hypothetical protein